MSAKQQRATSAEDANALPTKRQRCDAPASASATVETVEDVELAFHLTRLKSAPDAHNKHAIGIQELLSGNFTTVLLTNYMYDVPWLFSECPHLYDVPVVLVHGERGGNAMANECRGYANVTLVAPFLPIPYGTHHTKMMVVVYPEKVRVAIFTANYIAIDWDNKTQGVWHQDFELKTLSDDDDVEEKEANAATATNSSWTSQLDFEADLVGYLSCLGPKVAAFCKSEIARFDFSTATVALIPSVPGVHKGKDMEKYGHLRVRKLLQVLQVPVSDHPLICQFSSMGSLDEKWLFGEFSKSLLMGKKGLTATSAPVQALHIIWPSVDDVRNSLEGWNGGRAIPCSLKNMKPFLHKFLRKWTPHESLHRQNAMPHIKTYARFDPSPAERDDGDQESKSGVLDWAILTSANLSKAAWGAFQKNDAQFMIRSYELGVLFLPQLLAKKKKKKKKTSSSASEGSSGKLVVLGSKAAEQQDEKRVVLPLPYTFPITTYNPKTDEPWVWDVVREDPDIFGNWYLPR